MLAFGVVSEGLVPLREQMIGEATLPCGCETVAILERGLSLRGEARIAFGRSLGYFPCDEHGGEDGLVSAVRDRYAAHADDERFDGLGLAETLAAVVQEVIEGGAAASR